MSNQPSVTAFNEFLWNAYKGYRLLYNDHENMSRLCFKEYVDLLIRWCHSGDLESIADAIECHGEKIEPISRPRGMPL